MERRAGPAQAAALGALKALCARLQEQLPAEPEKGGEGVCELMFDVQSTGQRLLHRCVISFPLSGPWRVFGRVWGSRGMIPD